MTRTSVAVDGSARQVDGLEVAAWSWVAIDGGGAPVAPVTTAWGYGVDSYASELLAAGAAVTAVAAEDDVTVYSDCASAVKVLRSLSRYAGQGWRKRPSGTAVVARAELLAPIHATVAARTGRTRFVWVRGHDTHPGNLACDAAARACLRAEAQRLGTVGGKVHSRLAATTLQLHAGAGPQPRPACAAA